MIPVSKTHVYNMEDSYNHFQQTVERTGRFSNGELTRQLENAVSAMFVKSNHTVAVSSWTAGAMLVIRWLLEEVPIKAVFVNNFTFHATVLPWVWAYDSGGKTLIVPVDCTEQGLMCPDDLREKINRFTKAGQSIVVMPTDVFGRPDPIETHDLQRDVITVVDSAQSLGSYRKRQHDIHIVSMSPTKPFTALEGGLVIVRRDFNLANEMVPALKSMRDYGQIKDGHGSYLNRAGLSARMPEFNASVAIGNILNGHKILEQRDEAGRTYDELFTGIPTEILRPLFQKGDRCNQAYYAVVINPVTHCRKTIMKEMEKRRIETRPYFSPTVEKHRAFRNHIHDTSGLDVSRRLAESTICLPLFTGITTKQQIEVVQALKAALGY